MTWNTFRNWIVRPNGENRRERTWRDLYTVGRGTYGTPKVLHWGDPCTLCVGNFCSFAEGVTILLGGNHRTDWVTTFPFSVVWGSAPPKECSSTRGDVLIGNDVWVGYGATVLSGVTIGEGAIVGARAMVTHDVPPYAVVAGNPARLIFMRFPEETIKRLLDVRWWNWPDEFLRREYSRLLSPDVDGFLDWAATVRIQERDVT